MLRHLSEWQVRLLTTERLRETLDEIYGAGGTVLEVLSTHAKIDGTIERVARFRARESSRVVLVGRSKMFVEPLRTELDERWEGFLAALETGQSLGCVLGEALGTRMRWIDRGLNVVDPARHCRARELVEWFEHGGGAIIEHSRQILAEPARPLVDLDEYLAIEG
ncbi:MAG TPA: hypothetical protein VLF14_11995 [Candidatus Binatia bacterium]|nr:hypothetical protein [Candidatus Binatia bacterium]